jgi:hypothetical protein
MKIEIKELEIEVEEINGKVVLYHGGKLDNLEKLIEEGEFKKGKNKNKWSGEDFEGLFCSNIYKYAGQYGEDIIAIEVDKEKIELIQDCPLVPGDSDWKSWMDGAFELLIPEGIKFRAKWA